MSMTLIIDSNKVYIIEAKMNITSVLLKVRPVYGILTTVGAAALSYGIIIGYYRSHGTDTVPLVLIPIVVGSILLGRLTAILSTLLIVAGVFLINMTLAGFQTAFDQLLSIGAGISFLTATFVIVLRRSILRIDQQTKTIDAERALLHREVLERTKVEAAIKELNTELEQRVATRTVELEKVIGRLQSEITERQRTEQVLQQSQQRLDLALATAKASVWEWHPPRKREPDVKLQDSDFLACVHPEDRHFVDEAIKKTVKDQRDLDIEYRVLQADGSIHWHNATGRINADKKGNPEGIYGIQIDITERKLREMMIRESLFEKEILLKEIHHRVKNNLQLIVSMLNLQSAYVTDPSALEAFRVSQDRVRAISSIHEKLYQSPNLARINIGDYIYDLAMHLKGRYGGQHSSIALSVDCDQVQLGVDSAIPFGLILNEILSNAFKHAFPEPQEDAKITIRLSFISDAVLCLSLSDNGIGVPANLDINATPTLGLQLVSMLVHQMKGELVIENQKGTLITIKYPYC